MPIKPQFKSRSVPVWAEQFRVDKKPWPDGVCGAIIAPHLCHVGNVVFTVTEDWKPSDFLYNATRIKDGDWIVTQVGGTVEILSDYVFRNRYEPDTEVGADAYNAYHVLRKTLPASVDEIGQVSPEELGLMEGLLEFAHEGYKDE